MTTPPLDASPIRDVPAVHATIAASAALRAECRALYQLAAELLAHSGPQVLDPDVIDSPLARHHIGDALAGRTTLVHSSLVGISAVAAPRRGEPELRVASRTQATALLAPALDTVRAELGHQQASCGPPGLLTELDGARFAAALAVLDGGVALARSVSPRLADDLLTHIALVGIIDPRRAGRLVSASPRAFPGLVLLRGPQSHIEVAEALVHEGAHQKLFDLAITHDLLNTDSDRCPPFHPPWTPKGRRWPLEQALAACHAYICLTWFGHDLSAVAQAHPLGPESLLPVAGERSEILGAWLLDKGDYLGRDAHLLLEGLTGQQLHSSRSSACCSSRSALDYVIDTPLELRRGSSPDRVLVGRSSHPPALYWVSDDAATVLELLAHQPLDELTQACAQRWSVPHLDATDRLRALLAELHTSGLVQLRDWSAERSRYRSSGR